MNQANAMLGLLTQTSLHAGAGNSAGVIDLPIQREGHNGWPCVFGSAVKGALRTRAVGAKETISDDNMILVFGPDTKNAAEHAGAIAVGDARLLLLPVRSLTTHFKWVTCPEALMRLQRDAKRLGIAELAGFTIPEVSDSKTECLALLPGEDKDLFLEEYRFKAEKRDLSQVTAVLARLMSRDDAAKALSTQLVVVSDNMFTFLAQSAPPVNAHIALDSNTKTVRKGALWYEETLPPETLLYCAISANRARKKDANMAASEVLNLVADKLFKDRPWLQLGGNETVGMGWCAVKPVKAGG